MLPNRRCSHVDGKEPGRELLLKKKGVRLVNSSYLGKCVEQIGSADKSGLKSVAVFLDKLDKSFAKLFLKLGLVVNKSEMNSYNVRCLGIRGKLAALDELFLYAFWILCAILRYFSLFIPSTSSAFTRRVVER